MSVDLCKVPAGQPPEGTMSNFENPTTLIPAFMSMTGITVTIAIIVTVARIHTNFQKLTLADCQLGLDEHNRCQLFCLRSFM